MNGKHYELSPVVKDQLFDSNNDAEVPNLDITMQATECQIPFLCWGEQKRTYNLNNSGTLHFYTDDYRYNAIWEHPEQILKTQPAQIVEPNYSLFNEMPVSFALQGIYKKRWIARAMQERGIRVFVDLNVAQKFYKLNMLGIPMGWSAFCTRGYSDRLLNLEFEYDLAKSWAQGNKLLFVIYGGGSMCKRFAQQNNCIYVNPCVTTKKKLDGIKKIHEGVAFFSEEFSIKGLESMTYENLQIEDFSNRKSLTK